MTVSIKNAVAAVGRVLDAQTSNRIPLVARFVAADDWEDPSRIEIFSEDGGRRHVVSVSVEDHALSVDTTVFETTENGGFKFHRPEGMIIGNDRSSPSKAFEADLLRALDASPDVFWPTSSPGVATHPCALEMAQQSLIAADAYNRDRPADEQVSISLNPDGPVDGKDYISFGRPDGSALPIQVHTTEGGFATYNADTDELLLKWKTAHAKTNLAEWIGQCLADADTSAPAP